jgi:hypothetical protein
MCLFLTIGLKKWQEDPAGTDERMSKRCAPSPPLSHLPLFSIFSLSTSLSNILGAAASRGARLGTRTPRLQKSRRSCALTSIQESARRFAPSCTSWSAIQRNTKSKKVLIKNFHRFHSPPPRPPSGTSSSTGMVYSPPVPYVEVSKIGGGFFKVRREHTFRLSRMFASHTMARECRRFSRLRICAELSFISIAIAYQTTANSRNSEKCNFFFGRRFSLRTH